MTWTMSLIFKIPYFSISFVDKAERRLTIPGLFSGKPGTTLITRRFPSEPRREPAQNAVSSPRGQEPGKFGGLRGGVGEYGKKFLEASRKKGDNATKKAEEPPKDKTADWVKCQPEKVSHRVQGLFNKILIV